LIRKAIAASAVAGTVAALAILTAGAVAASSKTVDMKAVGGKITNGGTLLKGVKGSGKPFGACTIDVNYGDAPTVTQKWRCKGGTFKGRYTAVVNGDTVTGKPKLSGGTGKFKGIKGTLRLKGSVSKSSVRMTGKVRY
jgi:hypothetical protein